VTGLHVIADLYGCAVTSIFTDAARLEETCLTFVREAGLFDVGRLFHAFPGDGGVTGTVVLAESHLSVHTWPEHGFVSLDVYVCNYTSDNSAKARSLAERLIELFAPDERRVREVVR
jgi:S-adenosylmethionine decarboxylase